MRYPPFVPSAKPIGTIPLALRTVGLSIGFSPCCQSSLALSLAGPPYFRSTASQDTSQRLPWLVAICMRHNGLHGAASCSVLLRTRITSADTGQRGQTRTTAIVDPLNR